jgi:tetratricopeptide (TPR) repeat protein
MAKFGDSGDAGDLDGATADLTRAVEICRKTPDGHFRLADALLFRAACYRMARKPELAANDFAEVLRLDPSRAKRLHSQIDELAADFAQDGKPAEAAKWEAKAIESAPDEPTKTEYRARLDQYRAGKP